MAALALLVALALFMGGCELVRWLQLHERPVPRPAPAARYVRKPRVGRR
jgi:hypothetical protein